MHQGSVCYQLALFLPWHRGQEPDFSVYSPFSAGIENLPFELQRNFQLMRDLDQRTEGEDQGWFCCQDKEFVA